MKKSYKDRLLKKEYLQLHKENNILLEDNKHLSAIIHRDNKLIPSIRLSLVRFIESYNAGDSQLLHSRYNEIITYIDELISERTEILLPTSESKLSSSTTGFINVDSVIDFLDKRAAKSNVSFSFEAQVNIAPLFDGIVKETAFTTLLSDLVDNAIIAAGNVTNGNVYVNITMTEAHFCLNICDNGIHFDSQVLLNMGIIRYTTRSSTGGSGIGLMTTYKLLDKFYASFVLDETIGGNFTKKITICFDGLHQYRINTKRDEVKNLASVRKDIILL